jgi:hypothetical protein
MSMHVPGGMMGMGMGASVSMPAVPNQHTYMPMAEPDDPQGAYHHAGNIMYGGNGLSAAQVNALDSKKAAEKDKTKGKVMQAAGKRWRDPTLDEWPENDHRIFVGDLGERFLSVFETMQYTSGFYFAV